MDERVLRFRVGVMVVACAVLAAILLLLFGKLPAWFSRDYTVYTKFTDARGVGKDTPIRKSGIRVGEVVDVGFDQDGDAALVTMRIDPDVKLRENDYVRISTSLIGDSELEIVRSTDPKLPATLVEGGGTLPGRVAKDPLEIFSDMEGQMGQTLQSVASAGDEVGRLAKSVNQLLGSDDDQLNRIAGKTEQALDSFNKSMGFLDEILGDEKVREGLRRSLTDLPELLTDARDAVGRLRQNSELARRNLENVEKFTQPLGERGEQILGNLDSSVAQLDQVLTQLAQFSGKLNSQQGTLGRLVNDPSLHNELSAAVNNINELTRDLKPIVCDVRVFTDKIARHPEVFTRGIFRPSSGIK